MKENTILFIIIGIFLLTFIFSYKEGAMNMPTIDVNAAKETLGTITPPATVLGTPATVLGTPATVLNTPPATVLNTPPATVLGTPTATVLGTPPATVLESPPVGVGATLQPDAAQPAAKEDLSAFSVFQSFGDQIDPMNQSFDAAFTSAIDKVIDSKDAIELAIDTLKTGDTASANTAVMNSKITVKDALDNSKDVLALASSSKLLANVTEANALYIPLKNAYDYINKTNPSEKDLQSAYDEISKFDEKTNPPIRVPTSIPVSKAAPKPFGDECTETKVGCQWNKDPTDVSNWWTEHRENADELINRVQWNYHSLDVGDYIKYPWVYRNPNDKSNGTVQFDLYLRDKQNELNDLRKKMSSYDISFSSYQSLLRSNSALISSINAEKERLKKDLSGNYPQLPTISRDSRQSGRDSEPEGSSCPSLKCIADFGTNVGENLCCGQTGVLQNTEYVCPSSKPTCKNFKCGSKFGTCI
jgi:hypothetical protein